MVVNIITQTSILIITYYLLVISVWVFDATGNVKRHFSRCELGCQLEKSGNMKKFHMKEKIKIENEIKMKLNIKLKLNSKLKLK